MRNVVLISVDCLREDALGIYNPRGPELAGWRYRLTRRLRGGYSHTPNLDSLACRGVVLRNVFTAAPFTPPAHASILTGRYPMGHGVRLLMGQRMRGDVTTLAGVLRHAGYATAAFPGVFVLNSETGILAGFDYVEDVTDGHYLEGRGGYWRQAIAVVDSFLKFLGRADLRRPFFAFLHFFDVHHQKEARHGRKRGYAEAYWRRLRRMDAEVIPCLLEGLRRLGVEHETALVLTADHGEALGALGENGHGKTLFDVTLKVPLVYVLPWLELPGPVFVNAGVSRTVDIMPTMLSLLGMEPVAGLDGVDLARCLLGDAPFPVLDAYSETSPVQLYQGDLRASKPFRGVEIASLRTSRWRLIETRDHRVALYAVGAEGEEPDDVRSAFPETAQQMSQRLRELGAWRVPRADARVSAVDDATLERLRGLGYLD